MKEFFMKWILPVILFLIIVDQIYDLLQHGHIEPSILVIFLGLLPYTIKLHSILPKKSFIIFEKWMTALAIIGLIFIMLYNVFHHLFSHLFNFTH